MASVSMLKILINTQFFRVVGHKRDYIYTPDVWIMLMPQKPAKPEQRRCIPAQDRLE